MALTITQSVAVGLPTGASEGPCQVCGAVHYNHGQDDDLTAWAKIQREQSWCTVCWDCAANSDLEHFQRTGRVFAYLSCDEKRIVTWVGRELGRVIRVTASGGGWGSKRWHVVATIDGDLCYGYTFSNGNYVRLKRYGDQRKAAKDIVALTRQAIPAATL